MTLDPLTPVGRTDVTALEVVHWPAMELMIKAARAVRSRWHRSHLVARSFDKAQPGGHRVAFGVEGLLASAEENVEAFRALISSFGIRHWAHWNLLRPNLEASLWTLWILAPSDSRDRAIRALRLEVDNAREEWNWLTATTSVGIPQQAVAEAREKFDRSEQVYKQEAHDLHISWKDVRERINLTAAVPNLPYGTDYDAGFGHYVCSIWRRLSGAQHGKTYSLFARADRGNRVRIPGGESVFLTVNDDDFVSTCQIVNAVHLAALQRYVDWTTKPQIDG
jgi:hypothetical protein